MFPEEIFKNKNAITPEIKMDVIKHSNIGQNVFRVDCKVNGINSKRITQEIWGQPVNEIPVWSLDDRIVADWFALILEAKYHEATTGKTIIIDADVI